MNKPIICKVLLGLGLVAATSLSGLASAQTMSPNIYNSMIGQGTLTPAPNRYRGTLPRRPLSWSSRGTVGRAGARRFITPPPPPGAPAAERLAWARQEMALEAQARRAEPLR